jgi:hypothetical protein
MTLPCQKYINSSCKVQKATDWEKERCTARILRVFLNGTVSAKNSRINDEKGLETIIVLPVYEEDK